MKDKFVVADVHLSDCKIKEKKFISFVEMVSEHGGDLYILGDLFDYWANNRIVFKRYSEVLNSFADASERGVEIYFVRGNRDFLVSAKVFRKWGVRVVEGDFINTGSPGNICFTHGYALCTNDKAFLKYKETYWPIFKFLDPLLPGEIENWLATLFMKKSKAAIEKRQEITLEITEEAVLEQFAKGADKVVCGHTHKKTEMAFKNGKYLYVLPPWDEKGGGYGLVSSSEFSFRDFY